MARKPKHEEHVNHERWLVSYADFITLLFAFFVVMFSVGQTDRSKLERFVESVNVAFRMNGVFPENQGSPLARGGGGGSSIVQQVVADRPSFWTNSAASPRAKAILEALEEELRAAGLSSAVSVRFDPRGVVVSLPDWTIFRSGTATLRPEAPDTLTRVATALYHQPGEVEIEAHTDDLEVSTTLFDSNWELSAARAARLARFLVEQGGFEPERLSASGFAEFRPLLENTSEENREKNRRIDLVLVTETPAAAE